MKAFLLEKEKYLLEDDKLHFSSDIILTEDELKAKAKILSLKNELHTVQVNPSIHGFYEQKETFLNSNLYKALEKMPKGGLHHSHTTAAAHVDFLIKLTY